MLEVACYISFVFLKWLPPVGGLCVSVVKSISVIHCE
jgi:hypothetical protein